MKLDNFLGETVPTERIIVATAPDGTTVSVDLNEDDGTCCPLYNHYGCTLSYGHGGKWHIADDGNSILEVWPV